MLSLKNVTRICFLLAIISWISLLVTDLVIIFSAINNIDAGIHAEIPSLLLNLFLVFVFLFYKYRIGKTDGVDFIAMLWKVFMIGMLTTLVSVAIMLFFYILGTSQLTENLLLINFFYHINLGLIAAFLISTFITWKRLILYQKSKKLIRVWQIFEYSLIASILFNFFEYNIFDPFFNLIFSLLFAMGLILSVNLKWVAYLNFKQKWKSILMLIFVIIYLYYFLDNLVDYSNNYNLVTDLVNNVFILALFAFIFLYAIFSLLVILFNLPTSSVFEQKLEEVMNFQRLSQSIQAGQKEDQVYEILLDSAYSAVMADAAWIEFEDKDNEELRLLFRDINDKEVGLIKNYLAQRKIRNLLDKRLGRKTNAVQLISTLKDARFKSVLLIPLVVQKEKIGSLALLKEVEEGFNREMIDIINTFANQACISIENFRLLAEALENERYKEELKIAKKVQSSLLPKSLYLNEAFEIAAFSEAADEVGGDYYDLYRINDHKFAVMIGDVSGKGTSAAFNMSQMKGVFHSLVQLDLPPDKFLIHANNALSRCLEKTSFITASLFIINTKLKEVEYVRAGHCPTLYYNSIADTTNFFKNRGLGLGILRNDSFEKYVHVNKFKYASQDVLLMYTDGITEATNHDGLEYGYENLQLIVKQYHKESPAYIQKKIKTDLYEYSGNQPINDDYTALIIKFK